MWVGVVVWDMLPDGVVVRVYSREAVLVSVTARPWGGRVGKALGSCSAWNSPSYVLAFAWIAH